MTVSTIKMNLFDAPPGSVLVHACNAQGVWGRGIALSFKQRFPKSYWAYKGYCGALPEKILGTAFVFSDRAAGTWVGPPTGGGVLRPAYYVGCLITSSHYAPPDDPALILEYTEDAIKHLMTMAPPGTRIFSNKFNSGLFGVPWADTEQVLRATVSPDAEWTVCDPEVG